MGSALKGLGTTMTDISSKVLGIDDTPQAPPAPPPPPPPPAAPPKLDAPAVKQGGVNAAAATSTSRGAAGTILTSPQGLVQPANTGVKTLLGQ